MFLILCLVLTLLFDSAYTFRLYGKGLRLNKHALYRATNHCVHSIKMEDSIPIIAGNLASFKDFIVSDASPEIYKMSKLHLNTIVALVRSDVQNIEEAEDYTPTKKLPSTYKSAIKYIEELVDFLKDIGHPCSSIIKLVTKKESFHRLVLDIASEKLISSRDVIDTKRKVERILSLVMVVLIAHKSCGGEEQQADYLFFTKLLAEKLPVQEKHLAIVVLSRGVLATGFDYNTNKNCVDVQGLFHGPHRDKCLRSVFSLGMKAHGVENPSSTCRMLFPFAAAALRCFAYSDVYSYEDTGNSRIQRQMYEAGFTGSVEEWKLCGLLAACDQYDQEARARNLMTNQADEVLLATRRWVCDLLALHFINDDNEQQQQQTAGTGNLVILPKEVRRNTIAMELIGTDKAFVEGIKRHRRKYTHALIEIGRYLNLMCSMAIESANLSPVSKKTNVDEDYDSGTAPSTAVCTASLPANLKQLMTIISCLKYLPLNNKIRKQIEQRFQLSKLRDYSIVPGKVAGLRLEEALKTQDAEGQEPLHETNNMTSDKSRKSSYQKNSRNVDTQDEAAAAVTKVEEDTLFWEKVSRTSPGTMVVMEELELKNQRIRNSIQEYLLRIIGELLDVDENVMLSESVREEVDFVFSTWRRPYLLLDYWNIHSSSPEITKLYRRFLAALFGVSDETVDDIRYKDPGNIAHLRGFEPQLVLEWIEGSTVGGTVLPGYSDAQSLLMIGEDTHTCMTVRARQKKTNRGLLSILLNGSCRILGIKDSSGRLVSRSIVRLLLDELTGRPVLYVETPYGLNQEDDHLVVYDQAAELGRLLRLPVVYARPPPPDLYILNDEFEICALPAAASAAANADGGTEEEGATPSTPILCNLMDYSRLAPYIWVNGVFDHRAHKYLTGWYPDLRVRVGDSKDNNDEEDGSGSGSGRSGDDNDSSASAECDSTDADGAPNKEEKPSSPSQPQQRIVMGARPIGALEMLTSSVLHTCYEGPSVEDVFLHWADNINSRGLTAGSDASSDVPGDRSGKIASNSGSFSPDSSVTSEFITRPVDDPQEDTNGTAAAHDDDDDLYSLAAASSGRHRVRGKRRITSAIGFQNRHSARDRAATSRRNNNATSETRKRRNALDGARRRGRKDRVGDKPTDDSTTIKSDSAGHGRVAAAATATAKGAGGTPLMMAEALFAAEAQVEADSGGNSDDGAHVSCTPASIQDSLLDDEEEEASATAEKSKLRHTRSMQYHLYARQQRIVEQREQLLVQRGLLRSTNSTSIFSSSSSSSSGPKRTKTIRRTITSVSSSSSSTSTTTTTTTTSSKFIYDAYNQTTTNTPNSNDDDTDDDGEFFPMFDVE